jgi:hypothetical protein
MRKRDRLIMAIIILILILVLMGYVIYLKVMYELELEIGLGLLATAIGYLIRWIHEGNGYGTENNKTPL